MSFDGRPSISDQESPPLLEVTDLVAEYERGFRLIGARGTNARARAVDGVSLSLRSSEMLALVGESGCGKTTAALSVLGMRKPVRGSVRLDGEELIGLSGRAMRAVRRHVQMIYQDPYASLDPRFRARETIEEPMLIHHLGGSRAARRKRIHEVLERVELAPASAFADRYPHELSGGQRQRVAIAASLVLEPKLLIADEPVSMLDVSVRVGVLSLLATLRQEERMGILMITHDLSSVSHFADRIAVMYSGRIVEEGPFQEVMRNPQHPYTIALLSAVPTFSHRSTGVPVLEGDAPDPTNIPSGCRFHPRCPMAAEVCKSVDPGLRSTISDKPGHRVACLLAEGYGAPGSVGSTYESVRPGLGV
jgi:oligopeptide/dipeptide ABC transporter ATP-binding protein